MSGTSNVLTEAKGLTRDLIVKTAIEVVDRDGADGLTMRALARELSVVPMALYRYVHGREDLLEAVVDKLLEGVLQHLEKDLSRKSWQGYLRGLAHSMRMIAVDHAHAFPLIATRHPAAPWLRPPLRSLSLIEDFLVTLQQHGFTDHQAVNTYRAFSNFLLGTLLLESSIRGAKIAAIEIPLDEGDAQVPHGHGELNLSGSPETARLRPILSEDHSDDEFAIALERLLDRLEMDLSH